MGCPERSLKKEFGIDVSKLEPKPKTPEVARWLKELRAGAPKRRADEVHEYHQARSVQSYEVVYHSGERDTGDDPYNVVVFKLANGETRTGLVDDKDYISPPEDCCGEEIYRWFDVSHMHDQIDGFTWMPPPSGNGDV